MLPTTATAHSTPASARFRIAFLFIDKTSSQSMQGRQKHTAPPWFSGDGRDHFPRRSVEAHWPPLTPEHGFPSL